MGMVSDWLRSQKVLYAVLVITSLVLSLWISVRETVINPDAICYLSSANILGRQGITAAMQLCGQAQWPFYSMLIYGVAKITYLPLTAAAFGLNAIFTLLSTFLFVVIVKELGATMRVQWLALLTILCSHEFNYVREYIVRDHGFWAFYLLSMWALLRYFRDLEWRYAFAWMGSMCVATLFRVEGALFLLLVPFIAWFCANLSMRERVTAFFTLNLPGILAVTALAVWVMSHQQQSLEKLGRVVYITDQLQHGWSLIAERYTNTKTALMQHVLNSDSMRDAGLLLGIVLAVWYILNVLGNLSWIYAVLVGYAWYKRVPRIAVSAKAVVYGYLIINLMITAAFFAEHLFLSRRYLIALSLIFMLWVPYALEVLLIQWQLKRMRFATILVAVCMFASAMGGIIDFGYSKTYIRTAGEWLSEHASTQAKIYANDIQLMYYSQHFGDVIFMKEKEFQDLSVIAQGRWKQYDYLALRLGHDLSPQEAQLLKEIGSAPVVEFKNKRGDRVAIFAIKKK